MKLKSIFLLFCDRKLESTDETDPTSEINVLMLWIVLVWSGGIFKYETWRSNCPPSGRKKEPDASLRRCGAVLSISRFETSAVSVSASSTALIILTSKRVIKMISWNQLKIKSISGPKKLKIGKENYRITIFTEKYLL